MDSQKFPRNFSWILWVSSVKHWGQQPLQRGFCSYFFPDLVHSLAHVTGEVDSNNWKLTFEHRVLDSPLRLSELGRGFFTLGHGPGAWVKAQTCLDCVWSDRADSTHLFLLWALSLSLYPFSCFFYSFLSQPAKIKCGVNTANSMFS